ncbi:condensation domain-containing protein [Nocardia concava]|uniref:condensation domain-containing protein n=1 Tax=Nocardia concava TaxID=257281 RepID=UPI0005950CD9|nr:condensation domain-containing protein [Nocardia concava]
MTEPALRDDDIAVIGIGARFPDAANLAEFRENLAAGRDSIGPMPESRAVATGLDRRVRYLPMGHLTDIHTFDYAFFGLSKREASLMDPQQRIALELAHRAIEDAGYAPATLRAATTAVVFSAPLPSYHAMAVDPGPLAMLGTLPFGVPARIAHLLGFDGPCYAVDSGCNASLIAVHHACRELRDGDADYALAGGVSVRSHGAPDWAAHTMTEIGSPGSQVRAFDADADGTVPGEGGAALLLTTLARARADRAPIHAVIRGSAVLHNGHAAVTISTPSAAAQARVIARAWRKAGVEPRAAGYLEAHGSATRLGDAVELEGLRAAFADRASTLPIGSVKTNIGHLDHAAGVAGLVKAILSVADGQLFPSLHFDRPTGDLDLAAAKLEVIVRPRPWPGAGPRLAGVSSYSLGGANAHCVVQQAPAASPRPEADAGEAGRMPRLIGVSARTPAALAELCGALAEAVREDATDLTDVAYTLGVGRAHFGHRVAVCAGSTAELAKLLETRCSAVDPDGAPPVPPRVALLLSPGALPAGLSGSELPEQLPANGEVAEVLAAQLAAHDRLYAGGIRFAAVLSGGASKFAARYLLGAREPVEAGELAAAAQTPAVDRSRLLAAAEALLRDGPVVFVDPSPDGVLGRHLAADLAGHAAAEILFGTTDSAAVLGILGRLYERGLELDWARVHDGDGRRTRLPGHPLHGTRCWVDLPHAAQQPAITTEAVEPVTAPEHPVSDATEWLRRVLRELLHAETEIGPDDDYFDVGGNSIIAVQLVERVEEAFGFRPKLLDVYERPKVAEFADLLRDRARPAREARQALPGLPAITRTDELVMSPGQERMWFHHQLVPDTTLYNYPVVNVLRGPVDVDAVKGTFEDFAERHEPLRYNLVEVDGMPVVRVRPALGEFFRMVDASDAADPVAVARGLIRAAAVRPFDLGRDPLVRVLLVKLTPDMHVLQVVCHHCVTDGQTPGILAREIPVLYAARQEGRTAELEPLPIRYRDYARWHRDLLDSGVLDHELDYWRHLLADAPKLRLPTDFPRPARKTFAGELEPFPVSAALLAAARAVAKRESVSLFVVLLSAFYLLLARRSGQRDLIIGTPTTGRTRRELEGLIGFFNSTVALRANLSGPATLADLLERVRGIVLGALENQEIPFERVVNALDDQRDLSRTPIFDVLYVHQDLAGAGAVNPFGGGDLEFFDADHSVHNAFGGLPPGTAKFDLSLITYDRSDDHDMLACFEYSTELFTQRTAAGIAATYLEILTEVVESSPDRSIDELLSPEPSAVAAVSAEDAVALDIPTDRPRGSGSARYTHAAVGARLDTVPSDADLLAAWAALLSWYSGSDEVVIGSARGVARMDFADEPTGTELLDRAVVTSAAPGTVPSVIWFGDMPPDTAELGLGRTPGDHAVLQLIYATELFDDSTAQQMLTDLTRLLRGLLETPNEPVSELAMRAIAEAEVTR